MRTIGLKNKSIVKKVTKQVMKETDLINVLEITRDNLPSALWDIWEGADSEINRIIYDVIQEKTQSDKFE